MPSGFAITIKAIDQATATFDGINKRITALQKPVRELSAATQRFAQASGLTRVARELEGVAAAARVAGAAISTMIPGLAIVTGALSLFGLTRMTEQWAKTGSGILFASQALGTTVEKLGTLEYASRLAGRSAEDMDGSLASLRTTMQSAIYGGNPEAMNIFRSLNIDIGEFTHGAKDATTILPKIAEVTQRLFRVNPEAAAHFLDIIGVGRNMLRFYQGGAEGLNAFIAAGAKLAPMTAKQAEEAEKLRNQQTAVAIGWETIGNNISAAVAPAFISLNAHINKLLVDSMPTIQRRLEEFTTWLERKLTPENVGWFFDKLEQIGRWLDHFVENLRTLKNLGLADTVGRALGVEPDGFIDNVLKRLTIPKLSGPVGALQNGLTFFWEHLFGGSPAPDGSNFAPSVSGAIPPEGRAYLDALAPLESDGSYQPQPSSKGALGRYQFLPDTWREVAAQTGLYAWTPENQDRNAWFYAQQMFARNHGPGGDFAAFLRSGGYPEHYLNGIWTSLPGGKEHNHMTDSFDSRLDYFRHQYLSPTAAAVAPVGGWGPSGQSLDEVLHRLHLTIDNRNAPPGQTVTVTQADPSLVVIGAPRTVTPAVGR